jgi:GH15 family glucan-1,4-alpha-glucosidase
MSKKHQDDYQPIENYGIIGDLGTVALVGLNASIDFMCFPEFDSPSVFAKLLDVKKGGFFTICPLSEKSVKNKQMYLPDTNILLTRFLFDDGIGEVLDFMPISEVQKKNRLIRRVTNVKGNIPYRMCCCPRFNYGLSTHKAYLRNEKEIIFVSEGKDGLSLRLTSSVPLTIKKGDAFAEFSLKPDEKVAFVLENAENEKEYDEYTHEKIDNLLTQTSSYWKGWISKSTYNGRWREIVHRSALVLKLLISEKYGSIIAAPTFSLPEIIGGNKNWDYRYTWIRDAAFTVYALMRIGYTKEAGGFVHWVENLYGQAPKDMNIDLVYGINGRRKLKETILKNFEGYKKSSPVRIGNSAYRQDQLDIYGELMDSIYLYDKHAMQISSEYWGYLTAQINWLSKHWQEPDYGIWEVRHVKKEFLYSRVMCWVAVDRAIRLANKRSLPIPGDWVEIRDKIYNSVFHDFWDNEIGAFVQCKGSKRIDASCLLMPLIRFISPTDPKWLSTLRHIEKELVVDALVYRFKPQTYRKGSSELEGTFSLCSFWYAECLGRAGQLQKANFCFEKMLSYSNHLGLYSEQLGFQGEHLGNFPQAFTHLALISAAFDLDRRLAANPEYWKN